MNKLTKLIAAAALAVIATGASATTIIGTIDFAGLYSTDTGDLSDAQVFTFLNPVIADGTGDLAPLSGFAVSYGVLDVTSTPIPSTLLWSANVDGIDYDYVLNTIKLDNYDAGTDTRTILGEGILSIGSATAIYDWVFTTQSSETGDATTRFSFSASQADVPEPALALLLAIGLIGVSVTRRTRKTA